MTDLRPDIDLGGLARPGAATVARPRRGLLRYLIPLLLVLGFGLILFFALGDVFTKAVDVTVVRPVATDAVRTEGGVLFQAAGWVEPDPFAMRVSPLIGGVLKEVLVQPSDRVVADQVVARLFDEDAVLAKKAADAGFDLATAEQRKSMIEAEGARRLLELGLDLIESKDAAIADVQGREAEKNRRAAAVDKARAQVRIAESELEVQRFLAKENSAGPRQVELAEARLDEAKGEQAGLEAEAALAGAEAVKAAVRLARAAKEFELRTEPKLRADTAAAAVLVADARLADAAVKKAEAALRLERTELRAPADAVVLARLLTPGSRVSADGGENATVATLFDPAKLRVRVDVPQDRVLMAMVGEPVLIVSEARRERPYHGAVTRVVQEADLNKVTLQVHARVDDPDGALRPEMLCQVRFLSRGGGTPAGDAHPAVLVPSRVVVNGTGVFVVDPEGGKALLRKVVLGAVVGDQVTILSGLNITDKVIDEGRQSLATGTRLRVLGGG